MALAWLLRRRRGEPIEARTPEGVRLYAIGDIHGRSDLLRDMHRMIERDLAGAAGTATVVYLGDYIDRGLDSRGVLDILMDQPVPGAESVQLRGNHEEMLLRFLDDPPSAALWLDYGGAETLISYGVAPGAMNTDEALVASSDKLAHRIPARHVAFLRGLAYSYAAGDYFFVHAGIRPGVAIAEQSEQDLLWIRDEFLASRADHGRVVVHGHSIRREPELLPNRIGIDTGAFATGVLSCVVLDGAERRLLQTGQPGAKR